MMPDSNEAMWIIVIGYCVGLVVGSVITSLVWVIS